MNHFETQEKVNIKQKNQNREGISLKTKSSISK
jgi:hypothetical protein